jgi:F-type H+-transporting ATPase subunit b
MTMQNTEDHAAPAAPGHEPGAAGAHEGAEAAGGHSAGLPQFDVAWWPGQILWFLIIFFGLMIFMKVFVVPRLGGTIEARENTISGGIAEARRLKEEADQAAAAAQAEMATARANAQRVANEARAKAQAEMAARLADEEAKLSAKGAEAEARIAAARDAAMGNVQTVARDTAQAIVQKLTGKAPTAAELAAAKG